MSLVESIYNPIINALGWTLVHSFWQILALAIVWKIFLFVLRKATVTTRYNISLLALFTIPSISTYTFLKQLKIYNEAARVVSIEFEGGLSIPTQVEAPLFMIPKSQAGFLNNFENLTPYIAIIYLVGVMLFSILILVGYYRSINLKKRNTLSLPAEWQEKIRLITIRIGLKNKPRIFQSTRISVPALVGFFKPVVLLPVAMMSSLTTNEVEAIIYHELYHLKRYDHYLNMLQTVIETIFFYHPATWFISNFVRAEREVCIDELVVEQTKNPLNYAKALIKLEESRELLLQPMVAATKTKSKLFNRIKNIMTMKTRTANTAQRIAAFALIIAAAVSLAWVLPTRTIHNEKEETSRSELMVAEIIKGVDEGYLQNIHLEGEQSIEQKEGKKGKLVLENGKTIDWENLSQEDKDRITAEINQAMKELREYFSGDFKVEMEKVSQDVKEALKNARVEIESMNIGQIVSEELSMARVEVSKAMEEVREQLKDSDKIFKGVEDVLKGIDWDGFGNEMQKTMEGLSDELQKIGPAIQESLKDLNLGEILKEVFDSLEKSLDKKSTPNQ